MVASVTMPDMDGRRPGVRLATVVAVAIGVVACVPAPMGRATPDPGGSDGARSSAPVTAPPSGVASPSGPAASPSFVRPTPKPSPSFLVYEVRRGDSLISIGRQFGTNGRSIAYWNRDRYPSLDPDSATYEPDRIEVGWLLRLIPTEVVDEEDLPDPTPGPTPSPTPAG
jgi:hypothetical protein